MAEDKGKYFVVTDRELELLHDAIQVLSPSEDVDRLEIDDLEGRLASFIALPVDGIEYREGLVALLPEHLQSAARRLIVYNEGDEHVAVAVWCEADVFERAEERNVKGLTKKMAAEIIDEIDDHQDAEYGIAWGTIDSFLDDLVAAGKLKTEDDTDEQLPESIADDGSIAE